MDFMHCKLLNWLRCSDCAIYVQHYFPKQSNQIEMKLKKLIKCFAISMKCETDRDSFYGFMLHIFEYTKNLGYYKASLERDNLYSQSKLYPYLKLL